MTGCDLGGDASGPSFPIWGADVVSEQSCLLISQVITDPWLGQLPALPLSLFNSPLLLGTPQSKNHHVLLPGS